MSVSKWAYEPDKCDGYPCPGDCYSCIHGSGVESICESCAHSVVCSDSGFLCHANWNTGSEECPHYMPEPETGRWIPGNEITVVAYCSVCGWAACACESDVSDLPFCPNCGARLETED